MQVPGLLLRINSASHLARHLTAACHHVADDYRRILLRYRMDATAHMAALEGALDSQASSLPPAALHVRRPCTLRGLMCSAVASPLPGCQCSTAQGSRTPERPDLCLVPMTTMMTKTTEARAAAQILREAAIIVQEYLGHSAVFVEMADMWYSSLYRHQVRGNMVHDVGVVQKLDDIMNSIMDKAYADVRGDSATAVARAAFSALRTTLLHGVRPHRPCARAGTDQRGHSRGVPAGHGFPADSGECGGEGAAPPWRGSPSCSRIDDEHFSERAALLQGEYRNFVPSDADLLFRDAKALRVRRNARVPQCCPMPCSCNSRRALSHVLIACP